MHRSLSCHGRAVVLNFNRLTEVIQISLEHPQEPARFAGSPFWYHDYASLSLMDDGVARIESRHGGRVEAALLQVRNST